MRQIFSLILIITLGSGLSACASWENTTGLPNPFEVDRPYEGKLRNPIAARGITRGANIYLADVSGLPTTHAHSLMTIVRHAAFAKDIPVSTDDAAKTAERLVADVGVIEESNGQTLSVQWYLSEADGTPIDSFVITVPLGKGAGTAAIDVPVWQRLTNAQAEGIGQATAESLRRIMDAAQGRDPVHLIERRQVLLLAIYDAPGDGRRTLTSSLARVLDKAGYDVDIRWDATLPNPIPAASLVVGGWVEFKENVQQGADLVKITWQVRNSKGAILGNIAQENLVEHGQLQRHWGDAAYFAAQGAADGILDLLTKS